MHNFIDFDNILAASQQQQEEGALLLLQAQAKADIGCQEEKKSPSPSRIFILVRKPYALLNFDFIDHIVVCLMRRNPKL